MSASKAACAKPVGRRLLPLHDEDPGFDWDMVTAGSWVDGERHQHHALCALRTPSDILAVYADVVGDDGADLVMFAGTVPLLASKFIAGSRWRVFLDVDGSTAIEHTYAVLPDDDGR